MLYVFHVDTGTMLTLDMNLAMDTVSHLQEVIATSYKVPADKQVLLISGGENLDPSAKVCSYSAGTDTNPIFLFSKTTIQAATPPSASINYGSESDLRDQVEGSLNMSATYETVVSRAQLALQFHDVAKEELGVCERLVHDQHLQHQGWAAVIANLEDITSAFNTRAEVFKQNIEEYLQTRQRHIDMLTDFPETVSLLSKVPLLPCLIHGPSVSETEAKTETEIEEPKFLLEWISAQDSRNTLEQMAQLCQQGLQQMDETVHESLLAKISSIMEAVNNQNMKEVKGLEDRLYGLEQLLFGARKIMQEQGDMAQGFIQNQNRARNLQDASVLPDLCNSHKRQLQVMLKNHQNLRDIRRRCTAAKEELSVNLHTRLRWVMYVEESICEVDSKLVIHHESLKKLKRKLEIIQQMKLAPDLYASAVVEVVRRKSFSHHFMEWAGSIADECSSLHTEEVQKRESFETFWKHHFLQTLIPGLHDIPSPFATKIPTACDQQLPPIQLEDIDFLREQVPELADKLKLPEDVEIGHKASTATLKAASSGHLQVPEVSRAVAVGEDEQVISDIVVLDKSEESMLGTHLLLEDSQISAGSLPPASALDIPLQSGSMDLALSEEKSKSDRQTPGGVSGDVQGKPSSELPRTDSGLQQQKTQTVASELYERTASKLKSSEGTSPDLDDLASSEGFTTADFFIDESMPSSMTESAPSKKVAELQLILQDKTAVIETKDRELEEVRTALQVRDADIKKFKEETEHQKQLLQVREEANEARQRAGQEEEKRKTQIQEQQQKLQQAQDNVQSLQRALESKQTEMESVQKLLSERDEELKQSATLSDKLKNKLTKTESNLKALNDIAEKATLQLKCEVLSLEKQALKDKDEFQAYMESGTKKLVELISRFEEEQRSQHEKVLGGLQERQVQVMADMEQQLQLEKDKVTDAESQVETYEVNLKERAEQYDAVREEITELINKHQTEITTLKNQLVLENEVELERAKADLVCRLEQKDKEVIDLQEQLDQKATEVQEHIREKEQVAERLNTQYQQEKDAIVAILEEEHKQRLQQQLREEMEKLQEECEKLKQELASQRKKSTEMTASQLEGPRETEGLQRGQDESQTDSAISLQKHSQIITQLKAAHEEASQLAVEQAVQELRKVQQAELDKVISQFEKEKSDSLQNMRASLTAEKQVVFNEAVSKLTAEKDKTIEELQRRVATLEAENAKHKAHTEVLEAESAMAHTRDREQQNRIIQQRLEEELATAKQHILQLESQHQPLSASSLAQSVAPLPDPSVQDKLQQLETTLKNRDEEVKKLQQKLMEFSMTTSSRATIQDKVSITSCSIGDIVLLCLDEKHDHYVVFTVGTTLHFLHTECLQPLGLRSGPGQGRKSWVLAQVTDKEYCQAKKAQNRFKVPVGTKFYRVKAQPWNRESAVQGRTSAESQQLESKSAKSDTDAESAKQGADETEPEGNQPQSFEEHLSDSADDPSQQRDSSQTSQR